MLPQGQQDVSKIKNIIYHGNQYKHLNIYFSDCLTILVIEKTMTFQLQPVSLHQVMG